VVRERAGLLSGVLSAWSVTIGLTRVDNKDRFFFLDSFGSRLEKENED